jgi:peptide/nickel transport system substrate-binding protein
MADDKRKLWNRLPKPNVNKKIIKRRMRKVESATIRHAHKFIVKRLDNVREVQRNVVIWVLILGLLIAATGLQLMWNQQTYQTTAPANDGTYAEAVLGPVETLNPLFAKTSAEQSASYLMFSRLFKYDTTGHLGYDLASDIKINDTKTIYTVTIKPDVKWHDGTKLTAKDVAFTVDLMKDPATRTADVGWSGVTTKLINDITIEFVLQSTYAAFSDALTFPIVPQHILGKVAPAAIRENSFSQNPIGSGPFKLNLVQDIDTKSGRKVVYLARNDDYYSGTAILDHFQLHVYDTNDAIIDALSLNKVTAAAGLSPIDIQDVNMNRYNVTVEPIQSGVYAIINTKSNFLSDIGLRKALQSATNASAIIKKLPNGTPAMWLPFTTDQLSGDIPSAPVYDSTVAKKLLDDSGWKLNSKNVREKDGKELKLSVVTIKNSEFEHVLELLADQWRQLGIIIETKVIDLNDKTQNQVQSILQPRNFDVLLYQINIGADPDVYAYWHSSQTSLLGSNYSNYSISIIDDALISARARLESNLRNAKYLTLARQWLVDAPAIGLYQSTIQYVTSRNAQSFNKSDVLISPIDRYSDVLDWSVGSREVYKTP